MASPWFSPGLGISGIRTTARASLRALVKQSILYLRYAPLDCFVAPVGAPRNDEAEKGDATRLVKTTSKSDRAANPLLELLLRLRADLARCQLAVLEQHQGRNRHDPVFRRYAGVLIDIELDDLHLAIERVGNLFKRRADHSAWAAPFRPEINNDGAARLEHVLLKRGIGYLLDHGKPRLSGSRRFWGKAQNRLPKGIGR